MSRSRQPRHLASGHLKRGFSYSGVQLRNSLRSLRESIREINWSKKEINRALRQSRKKSILSYRICNFKDSSVIKNEVISRSSRRSGRNSGRSGGGSRSSLADDGKEVMYENVTTLAVRVEPLLLRVKPIVL